MPFGRFRGWPLGELPDSYIVWLIALPDLRPPLAGAIRREAEARGLLTPVATEAGPALRFASADAGLVREVLDAGYRQVARRMHPDAGGDAERMRHLNVLAESLRAQLLQIGGAA